MSEDTIKVNMNAYNTLLVVEQLKKIEQENKQLKERIDNAIEYIKKHIIEDSEYENYMQCEREEKEELLEILGDKE